MGKADAIIKHRSKTKFKSISDVAEVRGVGPSLAKNIKNDVYKKTTKKKSTKETKETKNKNNSTTK